MSVVVATSPRSCTSGQFARGYTAMLVCLLPAACGCCWSCCAPASSGGPRPRADRLLLAGSHPFGLFALFSELILLAVLGLGRCCAAAAGRSGR